MKSPSTAAVEPLFFALADSSRRTVLAELSAGAAASASALANRLPISRQAIAKHLTTLTETGLVVGLAQGREIVYEVRSEPLLAGARWLTDVAHDWDRRLAELKRRAESIDEQ